MAWRFDEIQTILRVHSLEDGNNHLGESKRIFLLMCTSWMANVAAQHQGLEWCQMESGYVFLLGLAPVQINWLEQPIWLWPTEHGLNDNVLRSCTIGDQPCTMYACKKGILEEVIIHHQKTNFPKCYSVNNHCSSGFFSRAGEKGRGFHIVYKQEIVNYYINFFSWGGEGWGLRGGGGGHHWKWAP